jgi:gamma-glutamyltranspeptidase / glutathione hydrolase
MDVATAELAPRLHHQHLPDTLRFERRGLEDSTVARLRQMGHALAEREGYQGDVQTIIVHPSGYVTGASDPRRGGAAVGLGAVRRGVPCRSSEAALRMQHRVLGAGNTNECQEGWRCLP